VAGVTVGLAALPLAMAFAIASGVPPQNGVYCAVVAGFIISALGSSGALHGQRARKGVFITTSNFSKEAPRLRGTHRPKDRRRCAIARGPSTSAKRPTEALSAAEAQDLANAGRGTVVRHVEHPITHGDAGRKVEPVGDDGAGTVGRDAKHPT